jgi:lysyl-tRNA synthetase, class I
LSSGHEAAFWADEEARLLDPSRPHVVRDSKTPSGDVPISALRGPVISDALVRTFRRLDLDVRFVYTVDDYDPMDSQSMKEKAGMAEHMGKPLCAIPSPDPALASDFAEYHASRFIALFARLGITPEFHRMRDLYRSGALDGQIDLVLRNAETIRAIHKRIANVDHEPGWLPISVICANCGRIGTTLVTDYDGKTVAYTCRTDYVDWAVGCGHTGRTSPFKGNAKLLWNEQWCAQWDHFAVTYEEGGKDLLTAGGSRERSNEIYREVFRKDPPLGLQHEFFLFGGKKMATSKDVGAKATDLVTVYPPEITRFLMLRTHPKRHIEFDPAGMTLPRLMDEYDRCADDYLRDPATDLAKVWRLSQVSADPAPPPAYRARFQTVANWLQIPSIKPEREAEREKAAPLDDAERSDLRVRVALARVWLERWAPDEAKFSVSETVPDVEFTGDQRRYLTEIKELVGKVGDPDEMQNQLYEYAKKAGLVNEEGKPRRDAFAAIYLAFIGKPNGPRAGMLLTSLEPDFVRRRLDAVASA